MDKAYVSHHSASYGEYLETVERWREIGLPEIILGHPSLEKVFGDAFDYADYTSIYTLEINYLWKNSIEHYSIPVYSRSDLLEKYNLTPVKLNNQYYLEGYIITEEMRNAVANGVPVEDVVEQILEDVFGPEE